jgi:diguanylate cyclase (GGDEF)-like protein
MQSVIMAGEFTFDSTMLPGALGVLIAAAVLGVAWLRRGAPGSDGLALLAASVAWWCAFQLLVLGASTLDAKVYFCRVQYLGIAAMPLGWLLFALDYTGLRLRLPRVALAAAALPALATVGIAFTNGTLHQWLWRAVSLPATGGARVVRIEHGFWFEIQKYWGYGLIALATAALVWYFAQRPGSERRLAAVLAAPVPALLGNLVYLSPFRTATWIDLTPFGLALGTGVIAAGLFRRGPLDLAQIARTSLVEFLHDGIAVVDADLRVTDMNPVAQTILGCAVGQPLPAPYRALVPLAGTVVLSVPTDARAGAERHVECSVQQLGPHAGTALLLRDVTERHVLEQKLRAAAAALTVANDRLERLAATDALTGLANRRAFDAVLEREVERARRYRRPLSLVLLDLDHFKMVNDTHGHAVGDAVLTTAATIIAALIRGTDTAARVGGEEIALLLPETTIDGAVEFADRVRSALEQARHATVAGARTLRVTASAGVASVPVLGGHDPAALYRAADRALYAAKRAGRNRVASDVGSAGPTLMPGGRVVA